MLLDGEDRRIGRQPDRVVQARILVNESNNNTNNITNNNINSTNNTKPIIRLMLISVIRIGLLISSSQPNQLQHTSCTTSSARELDCFARHTNFASWAELPAAFHVLLMGIHLPIQFRTIEIADPRHSRGTVAESRSQLHQTCPGRSVR